MLALVIKIKCDGLPAFQFWELLQHKQLISQSVAQDVSSESKQMTSLIIRSTLERQIHPFVQVWPS